MQKLLTSKVFDDTISLSNEGSIKYADNKFFISVINFYNNIGKDNSKYIRYYNFIENERYTTPVNYLIEFSGISNENLVEFNKCLLKTMKNVYAYNPDYDKLNIRTGDVNLQEYNTKFISNIISSNSKLTNENTFR